MNSIELSNYITNMSQNGDYVGGHSIFKGRDVKPNQILIEGLIIHNASAGLGYTVRRFESKFEDNLYSLNDLSYVAEEAVIIISIPKELLENYESRYFESYDSSSIVLEDLAQYSDINKDTYGKPTRMAKLPTIYILGYLDVSKDIFIYNSNYAFYSSKREINVSNLKTIFDKKYKEILRKKGIDCASTRVKESEKDLER